MNPDADINVCAVFVNGSAKLWATEYEENERVNRLVRRR